MTRVDQVHIHGTQRLRHEYLERNPGGDFKEFLEKYDALREAVKGEHEPVRFYALTFGRPAPAPASRRLAGAPELPEVSGLPDDDENAEETVSLTAPSIPPDDAGRLSLLQQAGLAGAASSLQEALQALELPFMFAGREQWVRNLARAEGPQGAADPRLESVTMESILHDENALGLLLGRAQDAASQGRSLADDLAYWQTLVPAWAEPVRAALAGQGTPFSVELLASPEINLADPSSPLFSADAAPISLFGLGVLQGGERTFLRGLSAEEVMLQIWPHYWRYYHRAAGAPVPEGYEAGLTFGSPVLVGSGYVRSPIMETDAYKRWSAYGQPGVESVAVAGGLDPANAPRTRSSSQAGATSTEGARGAQARTAGNAATGTGAAYEPYAPWKLSEDVLRRYATLLAG